MRQLRRFPHILKTLLKSGEGGSFKASKSLSTTITQVPPLGQKTTYEIHDALSKISRKSFLNGLQRNHQYSTGGEDPGPHDQQILDLLDPQRINCYQLDQTLAKIYQEKSAKLQLNTFVSLVNRIQFAGEYPQALRALPTFILGWMTKFHADRRLDKPPNVKLFGKALKCYSKSRHPQSGEMAEKFLNEIERLVHQEVLGIAINAHLYTTVMKAYAIRGKAGKAQAIFDRCMHDFEQGNGSARPDVFAWSTLIDAYAKSGKPNAGELALGKLREAEKNLEKDGLNTICYSSVIDAFAKSLQPEKAHEILEEMYELFLAGNTAVQPTIFSFNAVLNAWAQLGTKEGGKQSEKALEGARKCEKILDYMEKLFQEGTLPITPNTMSYSTVIAAYGRQGLPRDAQRVMARQNKDFLNGNQSAEPNVHGFLGVIDGWSKSGEVIAGQQAELILDHMEKHHSQKTLKAKPNVFIYNAVMKAWGVVGEPKKAGMVFHRMLDDFKGGNLTASPNEFSYSTLMNAYVIARLPDAGELADDALSHMKEMKVKPNLPVYMAASQCWLCSKGHDPRGWKRLEELQGHIDRLKARRHR